MNKKVKYDLNKIQSMFGNNGEYKFSRWSNNIVPIILGLNDFSLTKFKIKLFLLLKDIPLEIDDFEIKKGSNFVFIFFNNWDEIYKLHKIKEILPDYKNLFKKLNKNNFKQYKRFYFDDDGGITFCVFLIYIRDEMDETYFEKLMTEALLKSVLLWSESLNNFEDFIVFDEKEKKFNYSSDCLSLLKACYDPILPCKSNDFSHSLRVFSRYRIILDGLNES